MPADYEASRRRDQRFVRRFLFVVGLLALLVHVVAAALWLQAGAVTLAYACVTVDTVLGIVAGAVWLSGKAVQ